MGGVGWLYSLVKEKTQNSPKYKNYFKNCIYIFFLFRQETSPRLESPLCKHSLLQLQFPI